MTLSDYAYKRIVEQMIDVLRTEATDLEDIVDEDALHEWAEQNGWAQVTNDECFREVVRDQKYDVIQILQEDGLIVAADKEELKEAFFDSFELDEILSAYDPDDIGTWLEQDGMYVCNGDVELLDAIDNNIDHEAIVRHFKDEFTTAELVEILTQQTEHEDLWTTVQGIFEPELQAYAKEHEPTYAGKLIEVLTAIQKSVNNVFAAFLKVIGGDPNAGAL